MPNYHLERDRTFAARRACEFLVQGHSLLSLQVESPSYITEQTFSSTQEALLGRADFPSLETQGVPSQQDGSCDTLVPGIKKEPSYALEYQGDVGSKLGPAYPFASYKSALLLHPPTSSVQCFERHRPERGESQRTRPFILHHVCTVQGEAAATEAEGPLSLLTISRTAAKWFAYVLFGCLNSLRITKGNGSPRTASNAPESWGFRAAGARASVMTAWGGGCSQTNREPLCSQLQHVPWQIMVRSLPMPLGQDIQQGAAEQPSSQMQQLWNEGSTKVNCWDQECGSRKWF